MSTIQGEVEVFAKSHSTFVTQITSSVSQPSKHDDNDPTMAPRHWHGQVGNTTPGTLGLAQQCYHHHPLLKFNYVNSLITFLL